HTDLPRPARSRLIVEAIQPSLGKAASPLADRVLNRPDALADRFVLKSLGRQQNNLCPLGQPLRRSPPTQQTLKLLAFPGAQGDRCSNPRHALHLQSNQCNNRTNYAIRTLGPVDIHREFMTAAAR